MRVQSAVSVEIEPVQPGGQRGLSASGVETAAEVEVEKRELEVGSLAEAMTQRGGDGRGEFMFDAGEEGAVEEVRHVRGNGAGEGAETPGELEGSVNEGVAVTVAQSARSGVGGKSIGVGGNGIRVGGNVIIIFC